MSTIASFGKPVTLTSAAGTILLDNFTGSYGVGSTLPPVSIYGTIWDARVVATATSGVVESYGNAVSKLSFGTQYDGELIWGTGVGPFGLNTYTQESKIDIGYYSPISSPPDAAAEYRMSVIFNIGRVQYTAELVRLHGAPSGASQLGSTYHSDNGSFYSWITTMSGVGTWLCLSALQGNDVVAPVNFAAATTQLPDDLGLNSSYKLTVEAAVSGLVFKINDIVYGSLPYVVSFNPDEYFSGLVLRNDRRSYPGSGGVVNVGGFDSFRVGSLYPPPIPPFWGRFRGAREITG